MSLGEAQKSRQFALQCLPKLGQNVEADWAKTSRTRIYIDSKLHIGRYICSYTEVTESSSKDRPPLHIPLKLLTLPPSIVAILFTGLVVVNFPDSKRFGLVSTGILRLQSALNLFRKKLRGD